MNQFAQYGLAMPDIGTSGVQEQAALGLQLNQQQQDLAGLQAARQRNAQARQQQSQQQPGMSPQMLQQLMSSGEAGAGAEAGAAGAGSVGAGSAGAGTAASGGSGATAGGASAASGGLSGAGSSLAAAGPWAALAAAVVINEREARRGGHRREGSQYYKDLLTGKVLEQDINQRWAPKIGGQQDKLGVGSTLRVAGELATGDFSNAASAFDDSTAAKLAKAPFKAIKKLF